MNRKILISTALSELNQINFGYVHFEQLCHEIIKKIDPSFLPSTGNSAGGDGGIDGWGESGDGLVKYAFSIREDWKRKLNEELDKTDLNRYKILKFYTNQFTPRKEIENIARNENRIRIDIYGKEDLQRIIEDDDSLGRVIGIPTAANAIIIEYLNRHNQLQDKSIEIANYLPRKISRIDPNTKENIKVQFSDYCIQLPKFTILEARAGYGKTYCLMSLHQMILTQKIVVPLPPVFLSLREYIPGTIKNMIDNGMSVSGDYQVKDALLIVDGFDEVPESLKGNLLKEINQFLSNSTLVRKVILSVRENEYDSYVFTEAGWEELKTIRLEGLETEDIQIILENSNLPKEKSELLLRNELFQIFRDNIFYVMTTIELYKTRANLPLGMIELFEFLVDKEIGLLFRNPKDSITIQKELESLALYMTLHQFNRIRGDQLNLSTDLEVKKEFFEFSHKNIQEYLAAKKISKQPLAKVKEIIAKGNQINSYMTNTFGFLLNILNSDESYVKFMDMVQWSRPGIGNARKLMQIEPDKITALINHQIFRSVLEQEAKIGNVWEIPSNITTFCNRSNAKVVNIQFLVDQLISKNESREFFYYSLVLQMVINRENIELTEDQEESIKNLFLGLIKKQKSSKTQERIEYLLSIVTKFQRKFMNEIEYSYFKEKLLSYIESDSIFDKLCKLILISKIKLSLEQYLELMLYIFGSRLKESNQMASLVPSEINDDYRLNIIKVKSWENFSILTEIFVKENPESVWDIIRTFKDNFKKEFIYRERSRDLKRYLRHILVKLDYDLLKNNDNNVSLLKEWIADYAKDHRVHPFLEILAGAKKMEILYNLIKEIVLNQSDNHMTTSVFNDLLSKSIESTDHFNDFHKCFCNETEVKLINIYKEVFQSRESKPAIYEYAKKRTPEKILTELEEYKKKFEQFESGRKTRSEKTKFDYKIAFQFDEVKKEITKIFEYLGKEEILRKELWDSQNIDNLVNANQFALYLLRFSGENDEEKINCDKAIKKLKNSDWELSYVHYLLQYFYSNSKEINSLDTNEKRKLIDWMKLTLNRFPLEYINGPFKNVHITLSHVLRNLDTEWIPDDFKKDYGSKCLGLVFSGFPNQFKESVVVSYESYSFDYLDKVIDTGKIIHFIYENFTIAKENSRVMIGISGYLSNHKDKIITGIHYELKKAYLDYLKNNLRNSYYTAIWDCAYDLGVCLLDIQKKLITEALQIDEDRDGLKHNYAGALYMYASRKFIESDPETKHLSGAIFDAFKIATDQFTKKTFAEYYLEMNKSGGEVFQWYSNYLMENDKNSISSRLVRMSGGEKIYSRNLMDLSIVDELFKYSRIKNSESDRRRTILDFAIASYKAMSEVAENMDELQVILDSINSKVNEGHEFMFRVKSAIESAFKERNYRPLSLAQIRELE